MILTEGGTPNNLNNNDSLSNLSEREPKIGKAIVSVIHNDEGQILLIKRNRDPKVWAFSSGVGSSLKFGLSPEDGVYGEVEADVGIRIEDAVRLISIPILNPIPMKHGDIVDETVAFTCKMKTGETIKINPKYVSDFAWVNLDDPRLDNLPFDQPEIMRAYRASV